MFLVMSPIDQSPLGGVDKSVNSSILRLLSAIGLPTVLIQIQIDNVAVPEMVSNFGSYKQQSVRQCDTRDVVLVTHVRRETL